METLSARRKRNPGKRGRERFRAARPLLLGTARTLELLPSQVVVGLLGVARNIPGYPGLAIRYACVKRLAASCGENVAVYPGVYLSDLDGLHLGSNIKIGEMCFIGAAGGVVIEDDVSLAHAATVLTEEHDYTQTGPLRETPLVFDAVKIRRGVLIGAGVRITAGTEIGEGSIVGAGAVVTHDVPPFSVAAGVPARVLRGRAEVAS